LQGLCGNEKGPLTAASTWEGKRERERERERERSYTCLSLEVHEGQTHPAAVYRVEAAPGKGSITYLFVIR